MSWDLIGLIFTIILVLFTVVGVIKGFFWCLGKFIKLFASIIISTFLCHPIATRLNATGLGATLKGGIADNLVSKSDVFTLSCTADNVDTAQAKLNIPNFLREAMNKYILGGNYEGYDNVAQYFANAFSLIILTAITFIVLVVIIMLIGLLLRRLDKVFANVTALNVTNRILGGVVNFALGLCIVWGICVVLSAIISMGNGASSWLETTMRLNSEQISFSKLFYNYNPISSIVFSIFGI